ncbi:hypothetical protein MMC28_010871 [Mycoblastus sanguinarius]|nr:hypothetical protein [Mycoblastus sanguinarius]
MTTFDPSPRAAKRRKTTSDEPGLPFHSRVLRKVKQAVYGIPLSTKVNGLVNGLELPARGEKTPTKATRDSPREMRSNRDKTRPEIPVDSGPNDRGSQGTSSSARTRSRGRSKSYGKTKTSSKRATNRLESVQTPTKAKRGKYESLAESDEEEELTEHNASGNSGDGLNGVDPLDEIQEGMATERTFDGQNLDREMTEGNDRHVQDERVIPKVSHGIANDVDELGADSPDRLSSKSTSGRPHRRSRRFAVEGETTTETVLADTPSSRREVGRQKISTTPVAPQDKEGEDDFGFEVISTRDPPDHLIQGLAEDQSNQDQTIDTPFSKPRKNNKRPVLSATDNQPFFTTVIPDSAIQILSRFDPTGGPLVDKAEQLQQLLEEDPESLTTLKMHILEGLTGKRCLPLIHLEEEHQKVHQIVEQTVLAGEGNSMLIIGPRGSGKTTLVETVISELVSDYQDEFHVVRLNGFIHTDDKLALRETWRQLGREMEVEEENKGGRSNYADTLTSLLALLSHPAESLEPDVGEGQTAKSVIFILDEFDLFASHPRQTLLYNLFDVAQSRNAPIAVLGLTTKVNVVDSLEKRVKSRFGQRYVHLSPPKDLAAFKEICLSALTSRHLSPKDVSTRLQQTANHEMNLQRLSTAWNEYVYALFSTLHLDHFLQTLYITSKTPSIFHTASLLPIFQLTPALLPTPSSFTTHSLSPPDSKLALLPSLSTLSLSLLIAAARLDIILSTDICTFGMVYEEYVALASKTKMASSAAGQMAVGGGARVWSKGVARGAWEQLGGLELVLPAVGGRGGAKGEMWRVDVGLEEIGACLDGMEGGRKGFLGWCREI